MATRTPNGAAPKKAAVETKNPKDGEPEEPDGLAKVAADDEGTETRLRERVGELRSAHEYTGTLTVALLTELQPLLDEPIPQRYIETLPPCEGKPYVSTGLRSTQPQVDRLNAVLGLCHWRVLTHYEQEGLVARVVVIIGNNLPAAGLDQTGGLEPGEAEVLCMVEGWGGVKRGNHKGDILKGSETNALKRVLARLGPGSNVYRFDFDTDLAGGSDAGNAAGNGRAGDEAPASEAQLRLLRARARDTGVNGPGLSAAIQLAAGAQPKTFDNHEQAADFLERQLARLPRRMVNSVLDQLAAIARGQHAAESEQPGSQGDVLDLAQIPDAD